MAAFKGPYPHAATAARAAAPPRTWQQVPKWHWRWWFNYDMRIAVGFRDNKRPWSYRSHHHHARVVLEAQAHGVPLSLYDPDGANSAQIRTRRPKR